MAQGYDPRGAWPVDPDAKPRWLPIKTGQTLTKGDWVIDSSGQVAIALANSAELLGVIAQDCASLTAGTLVPVFCEPGMEYHAIADADISAVLLGDYVDIIGATGAMYVDADASTTDVLTMVRHDPEYTNTSAYCRCIVTINKHPLADTST